MNTMLKTVAVAAALLLSIVSVQAQQQGSDEARGNAQSWSAASGGSASGGAYARYDRRRHVAR